VTQVLTSFVNFAKMIVYIYIYKYTVKPVYNSHPRDWSKLAVIDR